MSITPLQVTDDGAASLTVINANFTELDTSKANTAAVVNLTGAQTIDGVKTFSDSPIIPAPTTDMQAATKQYVDESEISPGGNSGQIQFNDGGVFAGARIAYTIGGSSNRLTLLTNTNDDANGGLYMRAKNADQTVGLRSANFDNYIDVKNGLVEFGQRDNVYVLQKMSGDFTNVTLNFTSVAGTNKTFTFPNKTGVVLVVENTNTINIPETRTPASATATGTKGDICWDADYIYVCTATDTWKRTAISTW